MKKMSKFSIALLVLLIISLGYNIAGAIAESTAEPGSDQDPLVSKAYVDEKTSQYVSQITSANQEITALKAQLNDAKAQIDVFKGQIDELKTQLQSVSSGSAAYMFVTLEPGMQLQTGLGTEIILVSGKATAVAGKNGLMLDTTSAKTLSKGAAVTLYHMLVSAGDDGRGIKATVKSNVMVKGTYKTVAQAPANTTSTKPTDTKTVKAKVNVASLNLREQPSTTAKVLAKLASGSIVEIISTKGDWSNIKTSTGITGWVLSTYITKQ